MEQSTKSYGPMICWWDEKANLGVYRFRDGTFGTYSRPYGIIMGESSVENEWQMQEVDVCHGCNWDWANMEYDLAPSEDVIRHYPSTGNWPEPIEPRPIISTLREYIISFDDIV